MTKEQLNALAGAKGWKCIGSNVYGIHRNYPFCAYLSEGRMTTLTAALQLNKALKGRAVRELKKELPKGCSIAQPQVGTVHLVCVGSDGELEDGLRRGLDALTTTLQEEGLTPPDQCVYCHKGDCDAVVARGGAQAKPNGSTAGVAVGAAVGGVVGALVAQSLSAPATGYVPVHRGCVMDRASVGAASAQKNMVAGKYGLGVLGAVLGALVASIPIVALQVTTMISLYLLYILIPIAAWFGYKKLGGKQTMTAFGIVAAVTLVFTWFVVDQATFYFILSDGGLLNPLETIAYFYAYFTPAEIIPDLIYPTIWAVVGLLGVFGQCRKSRAAVVIEDAGVAMESLMSYTPKNRVGL